MIVPIVQAMMRHSLNVEDDDGALGLVEVVHQQDAPVSARRRRHIRVVVTLDDDDVLASFEVKQA
jgi:hypothetical protein